MFNNKILYMEDINLDIILKTTLLGLFFGTFGTTIGGIIGVTFKNPSNKFLSFILQFAAGLMTAIICFELVPEALEISNISDVFIGIFIGIATMILCDNLIKKMYNKRRDVHSSSAKNNSLMRIGCRGEHCSSVQSNSLMRTGIIVGIGLALHNFPEGLAIGSGFESSIKLGYSLALAIAFHDIPEGISMAVPMKNGGMTKIKAVILTLLSGVTTGAGAFVGAIVGGISEEIIGICLSFAAGAMLYIVSGELIPESNRIYKGRMGAMGNITGFILGIIATQI